MNVKNIMICGIDKDAKSDKLVYYCRDLDSPNVTEFEVKEMGRKYPSDFFNTVLMTNGHLLYERGEKYKYDYDFIRQYLPLVFTAVIDRCAFDKNRNMYSEIWSYDLYVIPNFEVIEMAKLRKSIKNNDINMGDGI